MSTTLERQIIGCLLLNDFAFPEIIEKLKNYSFCDNSCSVIFLAMKQLKESGYAIDVILVLDQIKATNTEFEEVEIYEIVNDTHSIKNVMQYVKRLLSNHDKECTA